MVAAKFSLLVAFSAKAIVHPSKRNNTIIEANFFIILRQAGLDLGVALQNE